MTPTYVRLPHDKLLHIIEMTLNLLNEEDINAWDELECYPTKQVPDRQGHCSTSSFPPPNFPVPRCHSQSPFGSK
jgi:hypothetical protein